MLGDCVRFWLCVVCVCVCVSRSLFVSRLAAPTSPLAPPVAWSLAMKGPESIWVRRIARLVGYQLREQDEASKTKGPEDDVPDAGFDDGMAYLGGQPESGDVLAMLDVMKSDFTHTIEETKKEEAKAQDDHVGFMTESVISISEMQKAEAKNANTELPEPGIYVKKGLQVQAEMAKSEMQKAFRMPKRSSLASLREYYDREGWPTPKVPRSPPGPSQQAGALQRAEQMCKQQGPPRESPVAALGSFGPPTNMKT